MARVYWQFSGKFPRGIAGHHWRWIDTNTIDLYYWSCWPPIISIHRLKIFYFWSIVSIIDHKILVKPMAIIPSVIIQPMVSVHRSKIGFPTPIFLNDGKTSKYSLIIGRAKYDGLKGQCQNICCRELLKWKQIKTAWNTRIKGNVSEQNEKKSCVISLHFILWHTPFNPRIPFSAFYWRMHLCFLHINSSLQQIFWQWPFLPSLHLTEHNQRWKDIDAIDRYYQSCWLPIVSIHRKFFFLIFDP
jgi:hypothetical protein